jgi:thymidylate synthase ThyX
MRVYALAGVPPEIQAYAMARYSRSAKSMVESIAELSAQRAEEFLNTFYFQYGHRSIADMAHLALAIEDISILAASRIVDEQLWDGQERSTRYQPFKRTGYYTPPALAGDALDNYRRTADGLFEAYDRLTESIVELLVEQVPRPEAMDAAAHRRTLRARAFDVSRSILPLATITSLGQIVSARVLERQISRLLSDDLAEVRAVGQALRQACQEPAIQPFAADDAEPVRAAPTLVKYTAPSDYQIATRQNLTELARTELGEVEPVATGRVELAADETPLDEAVATLLYRHDPLGRAYRSIQARVAGMTKERKREIVDVAVAHRGRHDDLLRELQVGYALKFDILMDFGSFRDLHRHRRCVQIIQPPTGRHGFDPASELFPLAFGQDIGRAAIDAGLGAAYDVAVRAAIDSPDADGYVLPMAARCRALFKMDVAQAAYITELRTRPGGHFSYRRVAWEMHQVLAARQPELAAIARPTDPSAHFDLLER